MNTNYDIFISYRRDGGAQYARILQLMLIQRGYKVFLDSDELTDGVFSDKIRAAIKEAPIFMLLLSEGSMQRCANEGDWVREEITLAIHQKKHIVPVNPDNSFDGFPQDMPAELKESIGSHQHSEISFGQALGATIDLMIKNRLVPTLGERSTNEHKDEDYVAAQESLRKMDAHNRFMKRLGIIGVLTMVLIVFITCGIYYRHLMDKEAHEKMRVELQDRHKEFLLQLNTELSIEQMATIDTLLQNMIPVYPDSIWMSQFEFTVGQWNGIKGEPFDESQRYQPMTDVSYAEIYMFLDTLRNKITNQIEKLYVELPSVEVWEYAAHGGSYKETTLYVGSNNPDSVAWYRENSGGHVHPNINSRQLHKEPNRLDLYDMSGNVSELCNSSYDESGLYTICGGDYDSPASEVTSTSRKGFDTNAKDKHVGFRIIIRKP